MEINKCTAALAKEKPNRTRQYAITTPGYQNAGNKIYGNLTRTQTATLARLRTGHCRLNQYLHRFNIIDSPKCACGHSKETVQHFLLQCRNHEGPRKQLITRVGSRDEHYRSGPVSVRSLIGSVQLSKTESTGPI
jgi:hypothetical protein